MRRTGCPRLQLLANSEEMAPDEIARLAEVAIGREHQREERLAVDRPEHETHARERDDRLAERAAAERVGGLADLLEDPRELDARAADVVLERALGNPIGDVLLDRNAVGAHQDGAESAAAILDDVAQDRPEAHGCSLRALSSQLSSTAITAASPRSTLRAASPSAARIRSAPRRSPCFSSSSAIVRVANAPLDASGLRGSGACSRSAASAASSATVSG